MTTPTTKVKVVAMVLVKNRLRTVLMLPVVVLRPGERQPQLLVLMAVIQVLPLVSFRLLLPLLLITGLQQQLLAVLPGKLGAFWLPLGGQCTISR